MKIGPRRVGRQRILLAVSTATVLLALLAGWMRQQLLGPLRFERRLLRNPDRRSRG